MLGIKVTARILIYNARTLERSNAISLSQHEIAKSAVTGTLMDISHLW